MTNNNKPLKNKKNKKAGKKRVIKDSLFKQWLKKIRIHKPVKEADRNNLFKKNDDMYFATINDGYIIPKSKKRTHHYYAIFKVKGKVRAVRFTHLYEPAKENKLNNNQLKEITIPTIQYPSAYGKYYKDRTLRNKSINLKDYKYITSLQDNVFTDKQKKEIRKFAKRQDNFK